jgi:uncharacterized protein YfaP (DUF2135 family)
MRKIVTVILSLILNMTVFGQEYVKIISPSNGWSSERIVTIKGQSSVTTGAVKIVYNGIPLRLPIEGGVFERKFIASPGINNIYAEVVSGNKLLTDNVSFYSKAPAKAMKIVLVWDTDGTDVDLHVIEPGGEECYYGHSSTKIGGSLDCDVTNGFGPEVYTLAAKEPGTYQIKVHYYSDNGNPQTELKVYVVINEGMPDETIKEFEAMLTKTNMVVNVDVVTIE